MKRGLKLDRALVGMSIVSVKEDSPMKRGLKCSDCRCGGILTLR